MWPLLIAKWFYSFGSEWIQQTTDLDVTEFQQVKQKSKCIFLYNIVYMYTLGFKT